MVASKNLQNQIQYVTNFDDLVSTYFRGKTNVICWSRALKGDFEEIVLQIDLEDSIVEIQKSDLLEMELSTQGQTARNIILNDMDLLEANGSSPILNLITSYEKDENNAVFATDVYSFHVDRAPIESDTILCTYYGECTEILPNELGIKKVLIPEFHNHLKKLHQGSDLEFESFLTEHFYDLHYQAKPDASFIKLELGHMCRIAIDHPGSEVLPCLHRAPAEKYGQKRLLLIC